ncbi:MAG: NUDIX hydrolase [Rhodobacteraceae bacterium]|nr:NUDIX hydrolase [Paracoccaceae bacterium]
MRRFGEPPDADRRYRRRPGVYAVLRRGEDVLLTHQNEPIPEFQLPGGGIDKGESPLAALHREVFEETGWRVGNVRRLGVYRRFTYMPEYDLWAEKLCTVYLARPVLAHGPPLETGHSAVWTSVAAAASLVASSGDAAFLRSLRG